MSTENDQTGAGRHTLRLADKGMREVREDEQPTEKAKLPRQFVTFSFFRARPEWRMLDAESKSGAKRELVELVESYKRDLLIHSYSIVGLRANADFMLWRIGYSLDPCRRCRRASTARRSVVTSK